MDTILYFYPLRHETSQAASGCKWAEYQFSIYRLIKIGLTPKAISLLQDTFEEAKEQGRTEWRGKAPNRKERRRFKAFDVFGLGRRKRRKEWERQREELLQSIFRLWGESCSSYCVCQSPITYFNKWQFMDYREEKWVDYLMCHGTWAHYVILGNAPCLLEVLPKYAKGMKSLRLFLTEREFDEELELLLELLFEEYGLAADIQFLEENTGYRKLPAFGGLPCNVLDFSKEEKVSYQSAVPDSIWIDFDAMEEKRRRFENRGARVCYFSLAKEWKFPRNLDTFSKNGYNTIVTVCERYI